LGILLIALARSPSVIFRPGDQAWRRRIEAKLDAILGKLGIQPPDPGAASGLSPGVRQLADVGQKIQAIKLYREATGAGLADSKDAVEKLEREMREQHPENFGPKPARTGCAGVILLLVAAALVIVGVLRFGW